MPQAYRMFWPAGRGAAGVLSLPRDLVMEQPKRSPPVRRSTLEVRLWAAPWLSRTGCDEPSQHPSHWADWVLRNQGGVLRLLYCFWGAWAGKEQRQAPLPGCLSALTCQCHPAHNMCRIYHRLYCYAASVQVGIRLSDNETDIINVGNAYPGYRMFVIHHCALRW